MGSLASNGIRKTSNTTTSVTSRQVDCSPSSQGCKGFKSAKAPFPGHGRGQSSCSSLASCAPASPLSWTKPAPGEMGTAAADTVRRILECVGRVVGELPGEHPHEHRHVFQGLSQKSNWRAESCDHSACLSERRRSALCSQGTLGKGNFLRISKLCSTRSGSFSSER